MAGLGVRVRPSGHRSYVYLRGGRKASLGPAALKGIDEARREWLEENGARRGRGRRSCPEDSAEAAAPGLCVPTGKGSRRPGSGAFHELTMSRTF